MLDAAGFDACGALQPNGTVLVGAAVGPYALRDWAEWCDYKALCAKQTAISMRALALEF